MNMNASTRLDDKLNALLIAAVVAIVVAVNIDIAHDELWTRADQSATAVAQPTAQITTTLVAAR
jgi:ABC-type cobalt transport system substrate-binding protein